MDIFQEQEHGVAFNLILQPRSSSVKLSGIQGDALKLRVCSAPVDNKANLDCIQYLSKIFSVAKRDVRIIQGSRSRRKRIFISNITSERARQIINEHLVE